MGIACLCGGTFSGEIEGLDRTTVLVAIRTLWLALEALWLADENDVHIIVDNLNVVRAVADVAVGRVPD